MSNGALRTGIDEDAALEAIAMRVAERPGNAPSRWSDDDRAWASRAAAAIVGEGATAEAFLIQRARLVISRFGERSPALPKAISALQWRPWIAVALTVLAFVVGALLDEIGGAHRVNLLAPPLFGVLAWNLAVYALLAVGRFRRGSSPQAGPLRAWVIRLAAAPLRHRRGDSESAIATLATDWLALASPLYRARGARVLHFAAASFAAGLIAGLYVRGLVFEYRATWESTFLDASAVRALVAFALSPGALFTGIAIPSLSEIAAIHAPASENAGRWLHLMAATVTALVIVPRMVLGLVALMAETRARRGLELPLDEPYFARLLRDFRGHPVRVVVAPYSYTMGSAAGIGLDRLLRAVFGPHTAVTILASTPYGGEDALTLPLKAGEPAAVIALFTAAATPELEAHGVFLERLVEAVAPGTSPVALVDESALQERWSADPARRATRRASWRTVADDRGVACAFAALAGFDPAEASGELERALGGSTR